MTPAVGQTGAEGADGGPASGSLSSTPSTVVSRIARAPASCVPTESGDTGTPGGEPPMLPAETCVLTTPAGALGVGFGPRAATDEIVTKQKPTQTNPATGTHFSIRFMPMFPPVYWTDAAFGQVGCILHCLHGGTQEISRPPGAVRRPTRLPTGENRRSQEGSELGRSCSGGRLGLILLSDVLLIRLTSRNRPTEALHPSTRDFRWQAERSALQSGRPVSSQFRLSLSPPAQAPQRHAPRSARLRDSPSARKGDSRAPCGGPAGGSVPSRADRRPDRPAAGAPAAARDDGREDPLGASPAASSPARPAHRRERRGDAAAAPAQPPTAGVARGAAPGRPALRAGSPRPWPGRIAGVPPRHTEGPARGRSEGGHSARCSKGGGEGATRGKLRGAALSLRILHGSPPASRGFRERGRGGAGGAGCPVGPPLAARRRGRLPAASRRV